MTFAFVVFCVPALPKTLQGSHFPNIPKYIWSKLRSTGHLSKRPSHDSDSWPKTDKTPLPAKTYVKMHEDNSQILLDSISKVSSKAKTPPSRHGEVLQHTDGVLRTTDIATSVDTGSFELNEQPLRRQHPWV